LDSKLLIGGAIVAGALFLGTQGENPLINLAGSGGGPSASADTGTGVIQNPDVAAANPSLDQLTKILTDFLGSDTSAGDTIKDITDIGADEKTKTTDIPESKKTASDGLFANNLPTYSQNLEGNLAGINEQYGAPLFVKLPLAGDATMFAVNPTIPNDTAANVQEVARLVAGASKGDASDMYSAYNPNTGIAGYVYAPKGLDAAFGLDTKKAATVPSPTTATASNQKAASNYYANILNPGSAPKPTFGSTLVTSSAPAKTATTTVKKAATINLWATPKYPSIAQMMAMG